MAGRMYETDPNQVSAGFLQGKCSCKMVKGQYDASPALIATNDNKKISNKEKVVVVVSDSSSSSESDNDFSCSSCPRKFSTQQALAGHRKIHKAEWESLLDIPDRGKTGQRLRRKRPIQTKASLFSNPTSARNSNPKNVKEGVATSAPPYHVANTTNIHQIPSPWHSLASLTYNLKRASPLYHLTNSTNILKPIPTNTLNGPSCWCHFPNPADTLKELSTRYSFASPTNTFKSSSLIPPPNVFPNAINTRFGPSFIAPQESCFGKTPHMPLLRDINHPLDNCAKPHGKVALGVRYESMIRKPCQCRRAGQSDMLFRTVSPLFGREQLTGDNIRCFNTNSSHADLRSLLAAAGSDFQPRGGRGIEAQNFFPLTPAQESHHHDIAHSSQGLVPKPDHNGGDADLDLKL